MKTEFEGKRSDRRLPLLIVGCASLLFFAFFVVPPLMMLSCVGCAGLSMKLAGSDARPAAEAFLADFGRGDSHALYANMHPELRGCMTKDEFVGNFSQIDNSLGALSAWTPAGSSMRDNAVAKYMTLEYSGTFAKGPATIQIMLKTAHYSKYKYLVIAYNVQSGVHLEDAACSYCGTPNASTAMFCQKCHKFFFDGIKTAWPDGSIPLPTP